MAQDQHQVVPEFHSLQINGILQICIVKVLDSVTLIHLKVIGQDQTAHEFRTLSHKRWSIALEYLVCHHQKIFNELFLALAQWCILIWTPRDQDLQILTLQGQEVQEFLPLSLLLYCHLILVISQDSSRVDHQGVWLDLSNLIIYQEQYLIKYPHEASLQGELHLDNHSHHQYQIHKWWACVTKYLHNFKEENHQDRLYLLPIWGEAYHIILLQVYLSVFKVKICHKDQE